VSETSSSGSRDDTAERDQAARHAERDEHLDRMTLAFCLRLIQYWLTDEVFRQSAAVVPAPTRLHGTGIESR
jgi:hypothetical protein